MKINTNLSSRDRSRITLSNFKGLDTLSAAVDVSAIHATDMKNLISRDGVNHKRFGWKTQVRIRDNGQYLKIQGIFSFTIFYKKFLLAYAGKKFWSIDSLGNYQDITGSAETIAIVDKTLLTDTECKCYMNGNKVYFIGCGDFLVFSKWNNDKFELRRVVGNEDVYIPTTTENISCEEEKNNGRVTAEEKNLLSPYTYNLLFGPKELKENGRVTYFLDSNNFLIDVEEISINADINTLLEVNTFDNLTVNDRVDSLGTNGDMVISYKKNDIPEEVILISFQNDEQLVIKHNSIQTDTISYSLSYKNNEGNTTLIYSKKTNNIVSQDEELIINYGTIFADLSNFNPVIKEIYYGTYINQFDIYFSDSSKKYRAIFKKKTGELIFCGLKGNLCAYSPIVPDVPNIKVKIKWINNTSDIVLKSVKACKFGISGIMDRLFIVDKTGNTVRWSKDNDFTYFGEKSWCLCGTSDKSITSMDIVNDSSLLLVKEYSLMEPSIYIITGNILNGETEAGTVDYTALFTPHGYQVGMGAVGEIVNFNGECIMVAKDGLYAVSLGENMTVDSRYVLQRSRQISNKLEKFDLSNAKCVSFNGKFFVYVGGEEQECYVADNKYTTSFEGDIQKVVNYEWWRWTNIPVNVWGFVENELWFGTEDGQLCSFTENFYDETFSRLHTGLATYEVDENEIVGFALNKDIKVSIGDIFTPTCDFYGGITTDRFECVNGETRFYLPLNDYLENEIIYINNNAYTITKQDLYFSIQYSTDSNEITFYRNYKNKPLTVMDEVVIVLKDRDNKFPKWSAVKSQGGLNPSNEEFTATLSHKEPVISKWVSGAMDLGTRAYSKTLTYFVLTGEKNLANRLKYGLKTRFTHRDYELLRANNDLDFTELDLQTVSMDSDFASSYTKKLNIRNINFLMLYFVSDTAEDIALNSVQIEFKLYKRNIGVR